MKPKTYDEKYEGDLELGTIFDNRLNDLKNEIKVQLPCEVVSINYESNQVDIRVLDYDTDEKGNIVPYAIIPNVPIRQPVYSGKAYLILPVQIGDIGTVEFFDSSVKDLISNGTFDYDFSEEWHSLDCGLFTNGFLPANKIINVNPTDKIILNTQNGVFTLSVNNKDELNIINKNNINIKSSDNIILDAPDVITTGNLSVGTGFTGIINTGASAINVSNGIIVGVI